MMTDIFSSFDPYCYFMIDPHLNLFMNLIVMLCFLGQYNFWMNPSRMVSLWSPVISTISSQLSRTYMNHMKGLTSIIAPLFLVLISFNLFGLFPYAFSVTSHLIFTLTFGLPLWMAMILSSFSKSPKASVAHFLPDGAPDWLNPFLVLIETTSIIVRPLTLSFRLAANMSAGHIVLSLVGVYCSAAWFSGPVSTLILLSVSVGYILFEVAICLIQAYIFCLLLSLYADDHAHN